MTDISAGAAPAAADTSSVPASTEQASQVPNNAPADEQVVDTPNPISTKPQEKAEEPKKPVSTREALEKAAAKVKAESKPEEGKDAPKSAEVKPQAKTADKPDQQPQNGQQKQPSQQATPQAQVQQPAAQTPSTAKFTAPDRFSNDAKAVWDTAPEPIKAEVHRAIRELEQGHQKYKADADAYGEIREYAELAKQHGTSVKDALGRYTGLERRLASPDGNIKAQAVAEVLQYAGLTPQAYAAYVTGRPANQVQAQQDATISSLRQEIASLKQQIGGVTTTIQDQRNAALMTDIGKFAETHERFDELAESIAKLITTGMAADLDEAYSMAERLNPAPAANTVATSTSAARTELGLGNTDDLQAQTLKGSKSVAGAPSSGSNPAKKGKPSSSIRESLARAQEQVMG
ncbi:hypothetical protein [Neorhizobium petrolearium]|uniref:hypothetical protein n=1 Tax=Neorhizobium petrolearium TaxID=515361 RepID=UPI003F1826E9